MVARKSKEGFIHLNYYRWWVQNSKEVFIHLKYYHRWCQTRKTRGYTFKLLPLMVPKKINKAFIIITIGGGKKGKEGFIHLDYYHLILHVIWMHYAPLILDYILLGENSFHSNQSWSSVYSDGAGLSWKNRPSRNKNYCCGDHLAATKAWRQKAYLHGVKEMFAVLLAFFSCIAL